MKRIQGLSKKATSTLQVARNKASTFYMAAIVTGLLMPMAAHAQSTTGFWGWIEFITSKMGVLNTFVVWIAFIYGLYMLFTAGVVGNKIAKGRPSEGDTWAAVGIKGGIGVFLMAITILAGGIFSGLTGQSAPAINSHLIHPTTVQNA